MITTTHTFSHFLILFGYLIAMVLLPQALGKFFKISRLTYVCGSGFFLFCGITHLGLVLEDPYVWWVTVTDHLQAICIWGFALCLLSDLDRAARRVRLVLESSDNPELLMKALGGKW